MTDLRTQLGAPDPAELVDAPTTPRVVVKRDAIRAAEAAAVEAIRRDLEALVNTREVTTVLPLDRLASLLAHGAFGAMVIPADYVQGYRDAMAKVRAAVGPLTEDQWVEAKDPDEEGPAT